MRAVPLRQLLACLLLLPLPAFADGPSGSAQAPEAPAPTGQLTRAPELLEFVSAPYPPEAEAERIEGAVGLLVDLDEAGQVTRVEVSEPAGHGFDHAATEAVKQFRFSPAEIDHQPAAVRIGYRYSFVLRKEEPAAEPRAGVVNLRGVALVRGTREPMANAEVAINGGEKGATTDAQGRFEIEDLPPGLHRIRIIASGFEPFETEEEIVEGQLTELTAYVRKTLYSAYQTVVRGKREKKEVARVELTQEEIRLIPGTQGDALKVVQNLPGVARAPYGFGLLVVRGGRPNDTRVFLDGVWVPLLFHFGGLTSVFNADLLQDIAFQPGNFAARNGRATAGVVEAETRRTSQDGYHGYANLNVVDATLMLEGPLTEELSFAVSGRRSHVDQVLRFALPEDLGFNFIVAPVYWDYQTKLDWAPKASRHRFQLMAFGSSDRATLLLDNPTLVDPEGRADIGMALSFHRLVGRVESTLSPTLRHRLMLSAGMDFQHTSVGADIGADMQVAIAQLRNSLLWDLAPSLSLEAGTDSWLARSAYDFTMFPIPSANQVPDPVASRQLRRESKTIVVFEPGAYLQAVWKPFESTRIIPGLRLDYENTLGYFTVDPRLSAFQQLREGTMLKGGIGIYQQPPDHRFGQWTESIGNPGLGAERALQGMAGVEQQITEAISVDVQLYYKHLTGQLQQSPGTVVRDGVEVPERWNNGGIGRAYGGEILLRHALTRNFFGWIAYSISRSERLDTLSKGTYRTYMFDQPHNLVVVASYKWPRDWITGVRFRYSSGNPRTPFLGSVYDADADAHYPIPGRAYSERGPGFVQLDLRVDKRFVFDRWMLSTYLDVQNVTNASNEEALLYNYDFTRTRALQGLPILPTLGVKGEF